jgi:hypothetical protein
MTYEEVIKNSDFLQLPDEEKSKVLAKVNSDFAGLPDEEKTKVITRFKAPTTATPQQGQQTKPQEPKPVEDTFETKHPYLTKAVRYGVEPALSIGGQVAGEVAGGGLGALAGGVGAPVGAVVGGAAGYTAGEEIGHKFEQWMTGKESGDTDTVDRMEKELIMGGAMGVMGPASKLLGKIGAIAGKFGKYAGELVGGGAAYTAGKETVNALDTATGKMKPIPIKDIPGRILKEMGTEGIPTIVEGKIVGWVAGKALKGIAEGAERFQNRAKMQAAKAIEERAPTLTGSQEELVGKAKQVQEQIPEFGKGKPGALTPGQMSDNEAQLLDERSLYSKPLESLGKERGYALDKWGDKVTAQYDAIRKFATERFGPNRAEDFLKVVREKTDTYKGNIDKAVEELGLKSERPLHEIEKDNAHLRQVSDSKARKAKLIADKEYAKVGDFEETTGILRENVGKLENQIQTEGRSPKDAAYSPAKIFKYLKDAPKDEQGAPIDYETWWRTPAAEQVETEYKPLTFQQIKGLRDESYNLARKAAASNNRPLARNAFQMRDIADNAMKVESKAHGGGAYEQWQKAQQNYKQNYFDLYRKGEMASILKKGTDQDYRVTNEDLASHFFGKGLKGAQDFNRVFGDNPQMKAIITKQAAYKLRQSAMKGGELDRESFSKWFNNPKNKETLQELGIDGKFTKIEDAWKMANDAIEGYGQRGKSVAEKIIDPTLENPEGKLNAYFDGKDKVENVSKLMKLAGDNEEAKAGLRNHYRDWLLDKMLISSPGTGGGEWLSATKANRVFRENAGVLKVLYKDNPAQFKDIKTLHDAILTVNRGHAIKSRQSATAILQHGAAYKGEIQELVGDVALGMVPYGHTIKTLSKFIQDTEGNKEVDKFRINAMFDGELAQEFKEFAKTYEKAPGKMNFILAKIGMYNRGFTQGAQKLVDMAGGDIVGKAQEVATKGITRTRAEALMDKHNNDPEKSRQEAAGGE